MEKRYLIVGPDSIVVNAILWDGETKYQPAENHQLVEASGVAGIGWTYRDGEFIDERPEDVEADEDED